MYVLDDAMEIMYRHKFRHLPVVDNGTILGVVSLRDVAFARFRDLDSAISVQTERLRRFSEALREQMNVGKA